MAQRVAEMNALVEAFVQEAADEESLSLDEFSNAASRFHHATQRYGVRSLKTRHELDLMRYQAAQLDPLLTEKDYPHLFASWKKIRIEYLDAISRSLGYKISSESTE